MNEDLQFRRRIQGVMRKYARNGERIVGGCCGVCSPRGGCCPACRGGGVVGGCCPLCRGGNFYQGGISADAWDELTDDDKRTLKAAQKMAIVFLKSGKAVGDTIGLLRGIADYARIDTYSLVSSLEAIVRFARATYIPSLSDPVKRAGLTKLVEKIDDLITVTRTLQTKFSPIFLTVGEESHLDIIHLRFDYSNISSQTSCVFLADL